MKSCIAVALSAILALISSCRDPNPSPREIRVETPSGMIIANATTVKAFPQVIRKAAAEDVARFQALAGHAPAFLCEYLGASVSPSLAEYDRAFQIWQSTELPTHARTEVIEVLGAYLGEELIRGLDMEWVTVTDELGTTFAVRHRRFAVIAYPFSSVMKRIDDQTYDFIEKIYYTVKEQLISGKYKENDPD